MRLRSFWKFPAFAWLTSRSHRQARNSAGNLEVDAFKGEGLVFCTRSVWKDEAAMRAFMLSGAHRGAMPKLQEMVDEAIVAHWEQDTDELPSKAEMHRRLVEQGRFTKLKHPSAAHLAKQVPPL